MFKFNPLSVALATCLGLAAMNVQAQGPPSSPGMHRQSREERIRAKNERVQKLIEAARKKLEAKQGGATPTPAPSATPAPGQPGVNIGMPGSLLPRGPIRPARMTPAITKPTPKKGEAAQGARSESRTVLLFNPLDSVVSVGDRFETRVVAETREGQVDEISILLHYQKDVLNPLAVRINKLKRLATGNIRYQFDPDNATVFIHARLKEPMKLNQQPVVGVIWEALKPSYGAIISYEFGDGKKTTAMYLDGSDMLGTMPGAKDGVVNTTVLVRSKHTRPVLRKVGDTGLLIATEPETEYKKTPETIGISLESHAKTVRAGDEFRVDLMIDNPRNVPFDTLKAYVQFNPNDLQVIDHDQGNVIRRGINISDGFARKDFPFNFYEKNLVDNDTGIVIYECSNVGDSVRGNGRAVSIYFVAKKDIPDTGILLVQNAKGLYPTTEVSWRHKSLLEVGENSSDRADVLDAVSMTVSGQSDNPVKPSEPAYNPFRSELARTMESSGSRDN